MIHPEGYDGANPRRALHRTEPFGVPWSRGGREHGGGGPVYRARPSWPASSKRTSVTGILQPHLVRCPDCALFRNSRAHEYPIQVDASRPRSLYVGGRAVAICASDRLLRGGGCVWHLGPKASVRRGARSATGPMTAPSNKALQLTKRTEAGGARLRARGIIYGRFATECRCSTDPYRSL